MFALCRRALSNANRYACIARAVGPSATTTTHQPTFVRHCSYEGDGKSTVKVLNIDFELGLMINSYSEVSNSFCISQRHEVESFRFLPLCSQAGFRLNVDTQIIGPMAIFPRSILGWNVDMTKHIDEHSLRLFCILEPKLDILIIGTGDEEVTPALINRIRSITKKYNLTVEVLKTEAAVSTFNWMNAESRFVAAALIPPKKMKFNDMGLLASQARYEQLYGRDPLLEDQNDGIVPKQ